MELATLPPDSARLAVELQLADINTIMQDLGAGDAYAAFDAMQAALKAALSLLQDQTCAMDILRADHDNRTVFQTLVEEERQAERDHRLASRMRDDANFGLDRSTPEDENRSGGRESWLDNDIQDMNVVTQPDAEQAEIFKALNDIGAGFSDRRDQRVQREARDPAASYAESSIRIVGKGKGNALLSDQETHTFCSACMEQCARFDVLELGCKREGDSAYHGYCRGCLLDLFQTSLTDTTLFPPRCCGKLIPISECSDFLPTRLVRQYQEKQVELASPNPVYCSNRYCARFIKPEGITADVAVCQSCNTETCAICKNPRHNGLCPKDPTYQALMEVANQKRWQRCPKCKTMVELITGCYHMRCRCLAEFCYLCARPWKTCSCTQWDESRLLSQDPAIVEPGNRIAMPEEEEILEADPAVDISNDLQLRLATVAGGYAIENGDQEMAGAEQDPPVDFCEHRWLRAYGRDGELEACSVCHDHLRFVNSCRTCKTKVCNRCLNNRL